MNGGQIDAQERRDAHERTVHLVDVVAVVRALLGDPVSLTELERGAAIVLCDTLGLMREITADGLAIDPRRLMREIERKRRDLPAARADFLAVAARQPALDLVDAVNAWDRGAVAELLVGLDVQSLYALVVVLAHMAGTQGGAQ